MKQILIPLIPHHVLYNFHIFSDVHHTIVLINIAALMSEHLIFIGHTSVALPLQCTNIATRATDLIAISHKPYDMTSSLKDASAEIDTAHVRHPYQLFGMLKNLLLNKLFNKQEINLEKQDNDISWQYKKVLYAGEIREFNMILQKYNIDRTIDVLKDCSDFKKSVLLKLHPDKGGNREDFVFAKQLEEKFSKDIDVRSVIYEKIQKIQPYLYKTGVGLKVLDMAVDSMRLINEPTVENTKKIVFDTTYLYGMYKGVNSYSIAVSAIEASYQVHNGEYYQGLTQVATTALYMAVPTVIGYVGIPYVGFLYGVGMTVYTGYNVMFNSYSLYQKYMSEENELRSAIAYRGLFKFISDSPLQYIYDFGDDVRSYNIRINNLMLSLEKVTLKAQMEEEGEFGQKLYKHGYASSIEEKYKLLNKILQGALSDGEVEGLKAEYLKFTSEQQNYEHCVKIKNSSNSDTNVEHYYCYNEDKQIFTHLAVSDNDNIEVVE